MNTDMSRSRSMTKKIQVSMIRRRHRKKRVKLSQVEMSRENLLV